MAGSINLSLSQQFDSTGAPLDGGFLYFYAAGTTTPQTAYKDTSLTLAWPNPIELDSAGRVPAFYLADGQIKIRLTNAAGVTQVAADNLLVVGASSGTGTPPSVDATTILATGDVKITYGTGALAGFVRPNGRTIGSLTSGATERANADTQALFILLWTVSDNTLLPVSGGARGASAAADWAANRNITLPDLRGCTIAGLDDMGSTAANRLTATYFGNSTLIGFRGGGESKTLDLTNLPAYTPAGTIAISNGGITITGVASDHTPTTTGQIAAGSNAGSYGTASLNATQNPSVGTFTGTAQGGTSVPLRVVQPTMVMTFYMKL